jgi:RNA polymerase sigma-70 factor (ECF subfamily)
MDEDAFRALFDSTARELRAYVRRVCGDASIADDVLQETFIRVLRLPEPASRPLLWRIATNIVRDRWRRAARERRGLLRLAAEPRAGGGGGDAEERVARALAPMKPQARALLWLAYVEGRSHAEIGAILGLRPASVRVLLFRARRAAARALRRDGVQREALECDGTAIKTTPS